MKNMLTFIFNFMKLSHFFVFSFNLISQKKIFVIGLYLILKCFKILSYFFFNKFFIKILAMKWDIIIDS